MITIYFGGVGSGKSTLAAKIVQIEHKRMMKGKSKYRHIVSVEPRNSGKGSGLDMIITEKQKRYLIAVAQTAISKGLKPWQEVLGQDVLFNEKMDFEDYVFLRKNGFYVDCSSYRDKQNWVRITKKGLKIIGLI